MKFIGMDSFELILFGVWGFLSFPRLWVCLYLKNFRTFSFEYCFGPTLFIPFWDSDDVNVGSFVINLQNPGTLFIFFPKYIPFCCSDWIKICLFVLKFTDFILFHLHSTIELIQWGCLCFKQNLCYCILKFCHANFTFYQLNLC